MGRLSKHGGVCPRGISSRRGGKRQGLDEQGRQESYLMFDRKAHEAVVDPAHFSTLVSPFVTHTWVVILTLSPVSQQYHNPGMRSEEHTSELQSRSDLVCRLLLEKKKITKS